MSGSIQNGDIIHVANKEIISISAGGNNILNYSGIYRIDSYTPGKDTVVATSNYSPNITVSVSSRSNSRSGKITINFVNTILLNTSVSIATITFDTAFSHEPKVIITQASIPAYCTPGVTPIYWAVGATNHFDIFMDNTPAIANSISFYYIVEG
jgi:hypothetical protein